MTAKSPQEIFNAAARAKTEEDMTLHLEALAEEVRAGRVTAQQIHDMAAAEKHRKVGRSFRKLRTLARKAEPDELGPMLLAICSVPSDYSQDRRRKNYMRLLVQLGADIETRDARGYTPMLAACDANNIAAIFTLVDLGANLNARGHDGATPLSLQTERGAALGGYLVRKGANLNVPGADGETALMKSARKGYPDSVKHWLEAGADPCMKNRDGKTAYDLVDPGAFKYTEIRQMIGDAIKTREDQREDFVSKLDERLTLQAPVTMKKLRFKKPAA